MARLVTAHLSAPFTLWATAAALLGATVYASQTPVFLPVEGGYPYGTQVEAETACRNHSKKLALCAKAQLEGHDNCEAGWCSDWEGYWMAKYTSGCNGPGYVEWSGDAGAYCCTPPPPPPAPGTPGKPRVVAWYDLDPAYMAGFPIADIDLSGEPGSVTHVVAGSGGVGDDGTVTCDRNSTLTGDYGELVARVHAAGAKIQWSYDAPPADIMTNMTNRKNFLATVRDAMIECDADGAEFDFEGPGSAAEADVFTTLLIELKIALCKGNLTKDGKASKDCPFVVSADSEPPQWSDYYRLNASKMDGVNIDFVNYMCYFDPTPDNDVGKWNDSINMLFEQNYPKSTINIAIPYYSGNTAWADLCQACPDLSVDSTNCSGTPVVGKLMNQRIGALARTSGIGGVFPWMLNYDSTGTNGGCVDNSLYEWLRKGIAGG